MAKQIIFEGYTLTLKKSSYSHDGSLAVVAETETGEPYANITVNLDFPLLDESHQFFDINMFKGKELFDLLVAEGILEDLVYSWQSGFVLYPLVKWNLEGV